MIIIDQWGFKMLRKFAFLTTGAIALAATPATAGGPTNSGEAAVPLVVSAINEPYAEAAAYVGQACSLIASKNIASVSHPTTGVCCLTLGSTPVDNPLPVVTIEWGASFGVALFSQFDKARVSCPAGTYEVRNYKADTGGVGSPLTTPALSDRVAFIFTLP